MIISLNEAVARLLSSQIVAFPTETVYGLGAVASDAHAVEKIYKAKKRPADNPLICHFYSLEQVLKYVSTPPEYFHLLIQNFCPGPISFRLNIPDNSPLKPATRGQTTVICRIPDHPLALELIKHVSAPIAAPSANSSGKYSPTTADMVEVDLGDRIDGVLDGGPCRVGLESTILDLSVDGEIKVLRPGAVGLDQIKQALEPQFSGLKYLNFEDNFKMSSTPGSKYKHYAPNTKLVKLTDYTKSKAQFKNLKFVVMGLDNQVNELPEDVSLEMFDYLSLGTIKNLEDLARNFYQNLARVDELKVDLVLVTNFHWPDTSLGMAIKDRFNRAVSA